MIAEFGLFSLILALACALLLALVPFIGLGERASILYARGQFLFVTVAYACLTYCFIDNDFTVIYVLANSSVSLPWFYKLCAVWGGHEGSMLLWVCILSVWMVAVSLFSHSLDEAFKIRVLSVLGWLSVGFILFLLATSNPFARQFQQLQTTGRDLNPLLQDPGFLFHPPMLYMGYVGFSVAFAFAISAFWLGRIERTWSKWARPWTIAAWCCLTLGITLGSWWAYRELGWGGWWFWDPVENASLMPWLVGTALLHALAVSEQRQQFLSWTLLLAITAFSLSLVGTFLVRSGVLTSVHAFAVDPLRGIFILGFLVMVIGGSLILYIFRAKTIHHSSNPELLSKESALLINNVLLMVMMFTVLLGTTYPLLIDGLGLGKISVGAPYFNMVMMPFVFLMLILMGFGIHLRWQKDEVKRLFKLLLNMACLSVFMPIVLLVIFKKSIHINAILGLIFASWVLFATLKLVFLRTNRLSQSFLGMVSAHLGLAITIIGISVSSGYGTETDVKMSPGEHISLNGYKISFMKEIPLRGPNYQGYQAQFDIQKGHHIKSIFPEKRIYDVGKMPMSESAIDVNPFRDIYIALGEPLSEQAWSVRVYYKPLIRLIWGGGLLMFAGGFCSMTDRRYFVKKSLPLAHDKREVLL